MTKWSWKIIMLSAGLTACTHLSMTQDLMAPDFLLVKGSKQVTFAGDNEHPRFSADSTHMVFASRTRGPHKGLQIYETDLIRNKERRVTFSDGDAFDPTYVSEQEILYSSTTDEIKESPFLNKNYSKESPPSDIYMSDLYGTDILRLTQTPGYDAEPFYVSSEKKPFILFSSQRGGITGVYRLNLEHLLINFVAVEKDKERSSPALTPDQKQIAFIERDTKANTQNLMLYTGKTKTIETLKGGEGIYRDLFFAPRPPARLFYSVLRKGEKQYQIEVYDLEKKCTQVVFKGTDSLQYPAISNELQERIAFTRNLPEGKQIYIANIPDDLGSCIEATPQATLKQ